MCTACACGQHAHVGSMRMWAACACGLHPCMPTCVLHTCTCRASHRVRKGMLLHDEADREEPHQRPQQQQQRGHVRVADGGGPEQKANKYS